MNIQTERLEDHTARFTVQVDVERLNRAKQVAARKIAQQVNIPGFRRGKAPYKVLVSYVGEAAILEDAVGVLGNEVYKEALDQADIDPYGPGELEDFQIEPSPTFTFKVALQPTVRLGDYRSTRLDYEPPVVDDEAVNRAMKLLQEQQAVIEESRQLAAIGDRVTLDIHSFFVKEGEEAHAEGEEAKPQNIDDLHAHEDETIFLHEHGAALRLMTGDDEPILPGFSEAMVGAVVDEHREFELKIPEDSEDYKEYAGQRVKFHVMVKKIETVTLPPLTDDLAARITASEEKPLTLLELRMRVRDNLEKEAERQAKANYSSRVLDQIVQGAEISYPDAMLEQQIDDLLADLDRRLRSQGITLDDYLKIAEKTRDDLRAEYREPATRMLRRMLVMVELLNAEKLAVSDQNVDEQIDQMVARFGEQGAGLRSVFNTPQMRSNIINDLMQQKLYERLADIGMGKAPAVEAGTADEVSDNQAAISPEESAGESA